MYELKQPLKETFSSLDKYEDIINTIQGDDLRKLMNVCFETASYLSFNIAPWYSCTDLCLEKELEPYLVKRVQTHKWFCYDLSPKNIEIRVSIYKAIENTKTILLKYFDDIFLCHRDGDEMLESTQTLEDLCIFSEKSLLLGTVTHEHICQVYPENETIKEKILSCGKWEYHDDISSEMIRIEQFL